MQTVDIAARHGWRLIPVTGKRPTARDWPNHPGLTPAAARARITAHQNLGVLCGDRSNRLFVVDIDGERPAGLPDTPTVLTGGGGMHLYYRLPTGVDIPAPNKCGHVAPDVDIRYTGGQVVYPGSVHPDTGMEYEWAPGMSPDDVPIADVPQWVIEALNTPTVENRRPTLAPEPRTQTGQGYSIAALTGAADDVRNAPKGARNATLNTKAYALAGHAGISDDDILGALLPAALDAGLPESEARATIASGTRAGREAPRELLTHPGLPMPQIRQAADVPTAGSIAPDQGAAAPGFVPDIDDLRSRRLSEQANAARLQDHYGDDLLHHSAFGWLRWDGTRWERNEKAALRAADAVGEIIRDEARQFKDPDVVKHYYKWANRAETARATADLLKIASRREGIDANHVTFDSHKNLLNCQNGTVDLATGRLNPHNRDEFHTKRAPIHFDIRAECPRWEQFMDEVFQGDRELINYVQWALAYSMTGNTDHQIFFILHGSGENGKSKFITTVKSILGGDYAQEIKPDELMVQHGARHTTEIAALRGVRFLSCSETTDGQRLNEALVKAMTGGEMQRARFMRQDSFEFEPELKLWFSTNHKPAIKDTSHGMWRRIRLIPFEASFKNSPKKDPHLGEKLHAERAGIMNWILRRVADVGTEPTQPLRVQAATQKYQNDEDVIGNFIAEYCVEHQHISVSRRDLFDAYQKSTNGRCETERVFNKRIKERGYNEKTIHGYKFWCDIGLKAEFAEKGEVG